MADPSPTLTHDEVESQLSDYLDGALSAPEVRAIEGHIEACTDCKQALAAFRETVRALSGLHRVAAPKHFDDDVAEAIRRRSAGRFFGRRAVGDRVPLEWLALAALALGLALYFFLWKSDTGSLRPFDHEPPQPSIHDDAPNVVPRPQ